MLKTSRFSFIPALDVSIHICFVLFITLVTSGCSLELQSAFAHIKGYLAWKRTDWTSAVLYFYEAEDTAEKLPHKTFIYYTDFALASTYLMQGEEYAATEKLQNIPETAPERVRAYCFYQQGIIAFRSNNYAEAAALFRKSLELAENDMEAKINYELSKKLADRRQEIQHQALHIPTEGLEPDPADSIIFDIIRKRERTEWAQLQHESEPAINDY